MSDSLVDVEFPFVGDRDLILIYSLRSQDVREGMTEMEADAVAVSYREEVAEYRD